VEAEEAGDLVHRVTAMDFGETRIGSSVRWFALRRPAPSLTNLAMLHGVT